MAIKCTANISRGPDSITTLWQLLELYYCTQEPALKHRLHCRYPKIRHPVTLSSRMPCSVCCRPLILLRTRTHSKFLKSVLFSSYTPSLSVSRSNLNFLASISFDVMTVQSFSFFKRSMFQSTESPFDSLYRPYFCRLT